MIILAHAGWNYDLDVSQTTSGQCTWVLFRIRAGMNATNGQPLASGLAHTRGEAVQEAERALENFLAESDTRLRSRRHARGTTTIYEETD
jgi:hypothetical protein